MAYKVAINGFGRIGRAVFRIAVERGMKEVEIVAINDLTSPENLVYLLRYDSAHGPFAGKVALKDGHLVVNGKQVKLFAERDPKKLPWKDLGVDVVVESTGAFTRKEDAAQHLIAGAKKVIITAPAKDEVDATIVLGTNEQVLDADKMIISNASCTTNCAAPMCKAIDDAFGIEKAYMIAIHAYTGTQALVDGPQKKMRRGRAAAVNIIPTTTGAAKAVIEALPHLAGKIDAMAVRVPVVDGSLLALSAVVKKKTSAEAVNKALQAAAKGALKGIMAYSDEELVSSDIINSPYSVVIDGLSTQVIDGNLVEVFGWFDNEWGYSHRVVDLLERVCPLTK